MTKTCSKCKQELPLSEFSKKTGNSLQSRCKTCFKTYLAAHYRQNKDVYKTRAMRHNKLYIKRNREYVRTFKAQTPCVKCGESDEVALDLHHLNPKIKEGNLSDLVTRSLSIKAIERELKKCVVLCANCHRKLHAGRFTLECG